MRELNSMVTVTIGKYTLQGTNRQELLGLKREIFNESLYAVDLNTPAPLIIDAGAHVGLASLYFKLQWPSAKIVAVEPVPETADLLRRNVWINRLQNIEVIEKALTDRVGETNFYYDQSADSWLSTAALQPGAWDHSQTSNVIKVSTVPLDSLLPHPVDLLKLDIEGAEITVLSHSRLLQRIRHLIIELHPPHSPATLQQILCHTHTLEIKKHHYGLQLCYATRK